MPPNFRIIIIRLIKEIQYEYNMKYSIRFEKIARRVKSM